jgi:uncharacterized repeat protein (TIGR01451 family)
MVRSMTKRGMPKPFAILVAALLALYFVPFNALPASATVPDFEIDGNQVHNSGEDWKDLTPGSMPDSGSKTNRSLSTFVDNTNGTGADATVFGSNNKEDAPGGIQWPNWVQTDNGNATGKSDYGRIASYSYVQNGHVFLVLGFDRGSNPNGTATANYYFELNQANPQAGTNPNPVRTAGDVRINLNDNGASKFTATVEKWDGTKWVAADSGDYVIKSNNGSISDLASWWTSLNVNGGAIAPEGFIETSLDLTSFGVVLGCPSTGFHTLNGRSTTGESEKNLVDYFAAQPISVPSSCASLFIKKFKGDGTTPLGGATFKISPNPLPVGTPGRPADNFLTIVDDSDANTSLNGGNYDDPDATAGLISIGGVIPNVEYTITEIAAPDGWILDGTVVKKTPVPFGTSAGDTNTASFTNHRGSVKFYKDYEGADPGTGASFTLTRDNDDADALYNNGEVHVTDNGVNDQNNTIGVIKVDPLDAGSWKLIEDVGGAPTGWIRDTTEVYFTVPDAQGNRDVVLANPTLTDPRKTYDLTVVKVAEADNSKKIDGAVFNLYKESTGNSTLQTAGDTLVGTCTTGALAGLTDDGQCTIANLAWGEKYYWYEVSVPAPYNLPNDRVIGPITLNADGSTSPAGSRTVTFQDPKSKIVTQATNGNLPNATISDTATLSGVNDNATGEVTFDLYYTGLTTEPTVNSCTEDNLVAAGIPATGSVHGPGDYTTGAYGVSQAGYYVWVAHYSGDENGNRAVDAPCDAANETSYVQPLQPGITTVAQVVDQQLPGIELYDTAKVSPVTGDLDVTVANVDFYLYGPGDTGCTGTPVFTSLDRPVTVKPDGQNGFYAEATSQHYVAAGQAGTYRWVAQFDGDGDNKSVDGVCNATNENTSVDKAQPTVTTQAGEDKTLGQEGVTIEDTATLAGGTAGITGTITFKLYYFASNPGSSPTACTGTPVATLDVAVTHGNGDYKSGGVVVQQAGWYTWTAQYTPVVAGDAPDDANNVASAVHGCGLDSETVRVNPIQPTITTKVPHTELLLGPDGNDLTDTATLAGGTITPPVTGSIKFVLYGPFATDPGAGSCIDPTEGSGGNRVSDPHNPQSVAVNGNGDYTTPNAVHVDKAGFYTWVATYGGDNNNKTATHDCGLAVETVQVLPRQPVISTQASATDLVIAGEGSVSFSDKATVSEATNDVTGTISFRLFGPGSTVAAACDTEGAVQGTPVAVSGNGTYQGPTVSVSAPGYYTWVATFTPTQGDGDNLPASHACGLPSETVHVFKGPIPTLEKIANPPTGSTVQPGDNIVYTVTVGNTGDVAIDDGVVTDTLPPYITVNQTSVTASGGSYTAGGDITKSAGTIKWTVDLAPGASKTFTYTVQVNFDAPQLATLVNLAEFFGLQATTTHRVPSGALAIVKEVSPVAGNGVLVEFGDKLTYTLTASATGTLNQPNVIVTDYLPGSDPARPKSGKTTYVAGSAKCIGAGTCTVTGPDAHGLLTWKLGSMAAGTSRQVTFQVTIDDVTGADGETVAVDILNAGAVQSDRTAKTPSNQVVTPVSKVLPVKIPRELPHTGSTLAIGPIAGGGLALLGLGLLLMVASRRRSLVPRRR